MGNKRGYVSEFLVTYHKTNTITASSFNIVRKSVNIAGKSVNIALRKLLYLYSKYNNVITKIIKN